MSFSNLKYQLFPALHQIISLNINTIQLFLLILGLVKFLLIRIILNRKEISHFFVGFKSHLFSSDPTNDRCEQSTEQISEKIRLDDDDQTSAVCRGDVEVVLRSLGMLIGGNGEGAEKNIPARLDILDVFDGERRNPRLDEVKEAFDVFDDNKDGFIDANELQKILCALGLKEGSDVENCTRMIGAFDENGDDRIDFDEFVKFMEISST